jgi:signal transduction histidine kinase
MHERERRVVAYEIHDGVAQTLAAAQMAVESYKSRVGNDGHGDCQRASALIKDSLSQARQLMSGQRPMILDEQGLAAAVDHLVCEKQDSAGPEIDCTCDLPADRLAAPLETAVFRIVQESLSNALRHSQSDRIRIRLEQQDDRVSIEVEDWGVGFAQDDVEPNRFGLLGIRERARLFGGSAEIDSEPGSGTRICVELPVVEAEGDKG